MHLKWRILYQRRSRPGKNVDFYWNAWTFDWNAWICTNYVGFCAENVAFCTGARSLIRWKDSTVSSILMKKVRVLLKNLDFLLKKARFLLKNPDLLRRQRRGAGVHWVCVHRRRVYCYWDAADGRTERRGGGGKFCVEKWWILHQKWWVLYLKWWVLY